MRVISLGLTCNNACIFCAQGELSVSTRRTDERPSIVTLIEPVRASETVALVGGEPTLRDDLPELCRALTERGVRRIVLQTNGRRLAYRTYAKTLREASDRISLNVSLHGSTEAMHDYHTSEPGSFRQTILGLRNARAEGMEACVTTVVTRSNYRHLAEIVKVCEQLSVRAVELALAKRFGRAARAADRILAPLVLVRPYLARALAEAKRARMGFVALDQRSGDVEDRFAGLGEVEPLLELQGPYQAQTRPREAEHASL